MDRGTLREATRVGQASKVKRRFLGGTRKKVCAPFAESLFGEEPEKQSLAAPQDAGKTPSACPTQRRSQARNVLNMNRPAPLNSKRQAQRGALQNLHIPLRFCNGSKTLMRLIWDGWLVEIPKEVSRPATEAPIMNHATPG